MIAEVKPPQQMSDAGKFCPLTWDQDPSKEAVFFPEWRRGQLLISQIALVVSLAVLMLGGCALQPSVPVSAPYAVSGKAVVRTPQGNQRLHFRFQEQQGQYDVVVWGALGVGKTRLLGTQERLQVTQGNQPPVVGPAAELMAQYLGWAVPLSAFSDWLQGRPATTWPVQDPPQRDDQGRLIGFKQQGWSVVFTEYGQVNGQWRPRLLEITGEGTFVRISLALPRPVMGS
jgi:outer membrane lipoprotein LolB